MVGVLQYAKRRVDALRGNYETQRIHEDDLGTHFQLLLLVVAVVFPIAVALAVSTKQSGVVTSVVDLLPGGYAVENYREVLVDYQFGRFMWNSLAMSVVIVVGKLIISVFAAMAIVYYRVPYKDLVFLFILFTLLLPVPVRFIPLFQLMNDLGWSNTILAITVPYLASATTVFILRQHFLSIPTSIVETAKLDGVGPLKFMLFVLLPMSKGVLVGVSIIMFVYAWNQYLWPLIIIDSEANQVAQVGLQLLQGDVQGGQLSWSLVMAGSTLTLLPPLLLMIVFRKPLLETFSIQQK
ncbi:carbohydrate ABC transporter permease [Halorubrum sp. E3]|uniref:sn-glycerol-3-phosphate transport system permease n=1 Tax=Halorubrum distributum JCM 10247 TaxID=1227486 RepID=M0DSB8_9EURY|nr:MULTISPECIES: carbohydrate ABC transporter permease [Halorubrum]ELZ37562.1 sn-glycerol-3-phosphate transport system permease [Halorubrum terrestre JCM 10247]OYR80793.1 carbohydrate ABC transporter permease [Halorubrum sp. E3]OYR85041.1 carbohydrate ABC transporter permease [Halorubrum distributum]RLM63359.1 carbohydrate ABC transporter permease [Halorubrum sp. Atlit-26R]